MSSRTLHTADGNVPTLSLPPGALALTDRDYEYDVEHDPANVEPIEHQIRLDFMRGGPIRRDQLLGNYNPWKYDPADPATHPWQGVKQKPLGLAYAETSCTARIHEERRFYNHVNDETVLVDAPAFLAARLRIAREDPHPERALKEERQRREKWYRELIPGPNLSQILKNSSYGSLIEKCIGPAPDADRLLEHNAFVGMVLVDEDTDPETFARDRDLDAAGVLRESALSHTQTDDPVYLVDYGIELPAPLLVGEYGSGSQYPLIPWGDALTCACPYKQMAPWRVMCKHELLASIVCSGQDSIFLPVSRGIDVPHRARRFVSPEIAVSHQSRARDYPI
ncbi:hypothetical protein EFA46_015785 (plasmid) [Halarchaeum sp. CBA1220]|uniref:hypothetical protein n=1 Tax=Halarchaeum sp. CBA1220 TaxID=1853682 RepID=UPI000F3A8EDD|nr:hypothetical protein [Halarchaeum sp. CBA1220]QLC35714.1 hypothetical protein EFA46_015785 [Halarchaeum sp. CBA1220]